MAALTVADMQPLISWCTGPNPHPRLKRCLRAYVDFYDAERHGRWEGQIDYHPIRRRWVNGEFYGALTSPYSGTAMLFISLGEAGNVLVGVDGPSIPNELHEDVAPEVAIPGPPAIVAYLGVVGTAGWEMTLLPDVQPPGG
jgi:hypothetical protein